MVIIGHMRSKSLLPIDELNVFKEYLEKVYNGEIEEEVDDPLWIEDTIEDLLIMAYIFGTDAANEDLGTNIQPDTNKLNMSLNKPIKDKTWKDRLNEYKDLENPIAEIMRIAETESHRIYNEAIFDTAISSGLSINKTWVTMRDLAVRDAHELLEGVSVKLDERFYTDGDSALMPGGFERADNNINCRCELLLTTDI